jgi:1-acyl-sn-glycerol-3-phosphate acyltransferase
VTKDGRRTPGFRIDTRMTLLYRFLRATLIVLVRLWFRPDVIGRELVPSEGPVILAPVHRSNTDFAFTALVSDRKLFFMAKGELWDSRVLGWILTGLGCFPVQRAAADRVAFERAQEVLELGQLLVLFPEGARREGAEVVDLHEGAAFLAARTGAQVVPMGIAGTDIAMPKGAWFPRTVKVRVVLGEPLPPAPRGASGRVPRREIRAATEALRAAIQAVHDAARA